MRNRWQYRNHHIALDKVHVTGYVTIGLWAVAGLAMAR